MSVELYVDRTIPRVVTATLRNRGVEVKPHLEEAADNRPREDLLDQAAALGCVLVTQDIRLLREAARRRGAGIPFGGLVYATPGQALIIRCVDDLEQIARHGAVEQMRNELLLLPLEAA